MGLLLHVDFSRLHQHVFKSSYLGFMASSLLYLASWLQYSTNIPFSLPHHHHQCYILIIIATSSTSLLHPYHYCHTIIITATLTSMTSFSQHHQLPSEHIPLLWPHYIHYLVGYLPMYPILSSLCTLHFISICMSC